MNMLAEYVCQLQLVSCAKQNALKYEELLFSSRWYIRMIMYIHEATSYVMKDDAVLVNVTFYDFK